MECPRTRAVRRRPISHRNRVIERCQASTAVFLRCVHEELRFVECIGPIAAPEIDFRVQALVIAHTAERRVGDAGADELVAVGDRLIQIVVFREERVQSGELLPHIRGRFNVHVLVVAGRSGES
jgi:hypothetical protein